MAKIKMTTPLVEMDGDRNDKNPLEADQGESSGAIY